MSSPPTPYRDATTKTCTTPEDCQKSAGLNLPSPTCPESYVFCVAMGGCVLGGCPEAAPAGGAHCDLDKVGGFYVRTLSASSSSLSRVLCPVIFLSLIR